MTMRSPDGARSRSEANRELGLPGVLELAVGYQRAQVLFTANDLGVFRVLAKGPRTAAEVAGALGLAERSSRALLDACVAIGLLRYVDAGYSNSRTARLFFRAAFRRLLNKSQKT